MPGMRERFGNRPANEQFILDDQHSQGAEIFIHIGKNTQTSPASQGQWL
jgi:hypothetical protein